MCVCKREKGRERPTTFSRGSERMAWIHIVRVQMFVCVCVCVCMRERERERPERMAWIHLVRV